MQEEEERQEDDAEDGASKAQNEDFKSPVQRRLEKDKTMLQMEDQGTAT